MDETTTFSEFRAPDATPANFSLDHDAARTRLDRIGLPDSAVGRRAEIGQSVSRGRELQRLVASHSNRATRGTGAHDVSDLNGDRPNHMNLTSDTAVAGDLLILVEQRQFLRGCLTLWLSHFCVECDIRDVAGVDELATTDLLERAAVVILVAVEPTPPDGWLNRQITMLRAERHDVQIVLIADVSQLRVAEALVVQLGLQGYIPTSSNVGVAAAALRLVAAGGVYFPHVGERDRLPTQAPLEPQNRHGDAEIRAILTPREYAVSKLLSRGLANKIIAHQLGMSLGTVKAHVHRIIKKLNLRNRTEVALTTHGPWQRTPVGRAGPDAAHLPPAAMVQTVRPWG